jgi:hypothetical protein
MIAEAITNTDIVLWALFELGGSESFVDVEEIMLKAFDLVPERFCWRTRPEIPDKLKGNAALHGADAASPKLLIKNGQTQRRLTIDGQKWIEDHFDRLASTLSGDARVEPPKGRRGSRILSEVTRSDLFAKWAEEGTLTEEKWRFADLFRCSPDSSTSIWRQRLETLRSAAYASGRDDILRFLDQIPKDNPGWF